MGNQRERDIAGHPLYGGLVGGVGAGIGYGTSVGNALKWIPDHRGLAAGLTAAAFGAGSVLTVVPIATRRTSRHQRCGRPVAMSRRWRC